MHESERPHYIWPYIHGLFTTKKLDIPALMIDVIHRVRTMGRKNTNPHSLCYPRFITAIITNAGYQIRSAEIFAKDLPIITYDVAKVSLNRLIRNSGLEEIERAAQRERERAEQEANEAAAQERGESSTPRSTPSKTISRKEYKEIMAAQNKMAKDNDMIHVWMAAQDAMNAEREQHDEELRDQLRGMSVGMRAIRKEQRENYFALSGMAKKQWGEADAKAIFDCAQTEAELEDQMEQARLQSRESARAEARARKARDRASSSRARQDDDVME